MLYIKDVEELKEKARYYSLCGGAVRVCVSVEDDDDLMLEFDEDDDIGPYEVKLVEMGGKIFKGRYPVFTLQWTWVENYSDFSLAIFFDEDEFEEFKTPFSYYPIRPLKNDENIISALEISRDGANVEVHCGAKKLLPVHSFLLKARLGMKDETGMINLETTEEAAEVFCRALYLPFCDVAPKLARRVYIIADEFGYLFLRDRMRDEIVLDDNSAFDTLKMAHRRKDKFLMERVYSYILENKLFVTKHEQFLVIPLELNKEILCRAAKML